MTNERVVGITEEILDCQDIKELKALHCFGQVENNEYADAQFVQCFKSAAARLKNQVKEEVELTLEQQFEALKAEVAAMRSAPKVEAPPARVSSRGGRKYRLLSDDVSWSTTPQVHGIMAILKAHVPVGGVISDDDAVAAMVANEKVVLKTRQGGEKILRYYLGNHDRGLMAHKNLEIVA